MNSIWYTEHMDNTVGSLTQLQRSIIIGSILGDGYVRIMPKRRNAFLEINHSYKAKEYVEWKYEQLKSIAGSEPKMRKGKGDRVAFRFYTRQHPEITELFQAFYQAGKKMIPETFTLDPLALAVWYMDDGSKCRDSDVYLNTQQFKHEHQERLINILEQHEIKCRMNKDKQYYRLRILKESLPKFRELIEKHIVPSMKYKLSYDPVET